MIGPVSGGVGVGQTSTHWMISEDSAASAVLTPARAPSVAPALAAGLGATPMAGSKATPSHQQDRLSSTTVHVPVLAVVQGDQSSASPAPNPLQVSDYVTVEVQGPSSRIPTLNNSIVLTS